MCIWKGDVMASLDEFEIKIIMIDKSELQDMLDAQTDKAGMRMLACTALIVLAIVLLT